MSIFTDIGNALSSAFSKVTGQRPSGYQSPGPYKTGYWLVVYKSGAAAIFGKNNLPPQAPGRQFFWLGSTIPQANSRLGDAINNLNLNVGQLPTSVAGADKKPIGIAGEWGAPGQSGPRPLTTPSTKAPPTVPGAAYQGGSIFGINFSSITDFFNFIGWLFDPHTMLRAVEFVAGLVLVGWGLHLVTQGRSVGGGSTSRIVRRAIQATPVGREMRVIQGRRMGRYEGQREAARMEARQRETRSVRESSANERAQISRSARERARDNS